jgi:hypothetical protein
MKIRAIVTGATGMVGEGVMHECLMHPDVEEVLVINRKACGVIHPKLTEIIHPNFFDLSPIADKLTSYNACYFSLGVSSIGMKEDEYTHFTYTLTMHVAETLSARNPDMVFCYVSGAGTDSSEKGRTMWARVKGKTENDLMKLPFKGEYNFRPGAMLPFDGQKNWNKAYRIIAKILRAVAPKSVLTMKEVGRAMINAAKNGYPKQVLEVADIRQLAQQH